MFDLRTILLILFLTLGFLSIALALPLIRREVGPNSFYGFRTRVTLADPGLWYDANAYAGKSLFGYGLGVGLGSLILYLIPLSELAYAWTCLVIILGGLAVSLFLCFSHLRRRVKIHVSKGTDVKYGR